MEDWKRQAEAMFPNGRVIFYDGDDPEGFRKEMIEKFNFDPEKSLNPSMWNARCGYAFYCPGEHYRAVYLDDKYSVGS